MMNMDIIAILLTIIAVFIAVFLFRRFLIWIALILILAVIGYFVLQNSGDGTWFNMRNNHRVNNFLEEFKDNYCGLLYDRDDSLLCEIIVKPIYQDIISTHSQDELAKMNKVQMTQLIISTASKHKKEIITRLAKQKVPYLWEDFITDIKNKTIY